MSRTSPSISTLTGLLEAQHSRCEAFLDLLHREQRAIKSLASSTLVELSQAKLSLLDELRALEEQRTDTVSGIADHWGIPPDHLTLRAIEERVGAGEAPRLQRLHARLSKVVEAVRDATRLNGELLARSLAILNEGLNVWCRTTKPAGLYSSQGGMNTGYHHGALVQQKG